MATLTDAERAAIRARIGKGRAKWTGRRRGIGGMTGAATLRLLAWLHELGVENAEAQLRARLAERSPDLPEPIPTPRRRRRED